MRFVAVPGRFPAGTPRCQWSTTTQLEVRLARRRQDVAAAQALRYRVFFKETGAAANLKTRVLRRGIDRFDRACDHLLVIDPTRAAEASGRCPARSSEPVD
jgi:putative hemolysin